MAALGLLPAIGTIVFGPPTSFSILPVRMPLGAGVEGLGPLEHRQRIVAARVVAGRRGGEAQVGRQHLVQHVGLRQAHGGLGGDAHAVLDEGHDRRAGPGGGETLGRRDVGGSEEVRGLALRQAVGQEPRGPVDGRREGVGGLARGLDQRRHHARQAPGGIDLHGRGLGHGPEAEHEGRHDDESAAARRRSGKAGRSIGVSRVRAARAARASRYSPRATTRRGSARGRSPAGSRQPAG